LKSDPMGMCEVSVQDLTDSAPVLEQWVEVLPDAFMSPSITNLGMIHVRVERKSI